MRYAIELISTIDELVKRKKASAEATLSIQVETVAVCFLLDASEAGHQQLAAIADQQGPSEIQGMALLAQRTLGYLKSKGVTKENAKEYMAERLRNFEAGLP